MTTLVEHLEGVIEDWVAWDLREESGNDADPIATVLTNYKETSNEAGEATVIAVLPGAVCTYELSVHPTAGTGTDLRRTLIPAKRIQSVVRLSHVRNTLDRSAYKYRMLSIILQLEGDLDDITVATEPHWYMNTGEEADRRMKEVSLALEALIVNHT